MAPQRHGKRHTATNALVPYDKSGSQRSQRQNDNEESARFLMLQLTASRYFAYSCFRSFDGASMVTLLVGEKENPFHVHMEMICKESPFFNSAFMGAGQFEETAQKLMKLPEDDPGTIDRMIQWIYFKTFSFDQKAATKKCQKAQFAFKQLASLYVAADRFGITALKNEVVNQLFMFAELESYLPDDGVVEYIYNNTTPHSKLRRLIVEWHVWWLEPKWYKTSVDGSFVRENSDFAADLIARMAARIGGRKCPWPDYKRRFLEDDTGSEESEEDSDSDSQTGNSNESSSGNESSSTA